MFRFNASLRTKLIVLLFVVSAIPLVVSIYLVENITVLIQNVSSNEAALIKPQLEKAAMAYRDQIDLRKRYYKDAVARPLAIARANGEPLQGHDDLLGISTPNEVKDFSPSWEVKIKDDPMVTYHFKIDPTLQRNLQELTNSIYRIDRIKTMKSKLPRSYNYAFIAVLGGVVALVTLAALIIASFITRRLRNLVAATEAVASGDLNIKVDETGGDEVANLAESFNVMTSALKNEQERVSYLERLNTWKEIAKHLAHEIKNPLTPIRLAVELCASKYDGSDPSFRKLLDDTASIVDEEIRHLEHLVNEFRGLSKLPQPQKTPGDLREFLRALCKTPNYKDWVTLQSDGELPVSFDEVLLKRAFVNLLDNAKESATSSPKAAINVTTTSKQVQIRITDNGSGISESLKPQVFDPYVTTKDTGTGLGLALVKKTCLDHEGSIIIEKTSPSGTTFLITLPLAN